MAKMLTPVVRSTLSSAAFEQLTSFIVNGQWKSGDRIPPERDLSAELGIARTSLREALKAMEFVGMLESRVGDGTFVCPRSEFLAKPMLWAFTGTDPEELQDVVESRALLEVDLAGLAAARASQAEIDEIGETIELMRSETTKGRSIFEADMKFHLVIASAAHNEVLSHAVQLLRNMLRHWIYLKLQLPEVPGQVIQEHVAIFEAIRNRDSVAARASMLHHLEQTSKFVGQVTPHHDGAGSARSN